MKNTQSLKGGCICGQVKYQITDKPLFTQACHCKDCKVITGSSYVVNTSVLENTLMVEGEISSTKLTAGSGAASRAFFCTKCGTYVYTDYDSAVGRLTVRTKTLEDPDKFPPQAHIFTRTKVNWIHLDNKIPSFEICYDRDELWPQASLDRLSGLF
mgnify:CR=1 FL=1